MLGVLLAFRRLAANSELDVLRGVGMSYNRLLRVPMLYAIVLAALNLAIVGYVQPIARYYYEGLRFELRTGALGASIKVGEFTQLGSKMTLRIEQSRDKGRDLSGIFVQAKDREGRCARSHCRAWRIPSHRRSQHDHLPPDERHADPRPRRFQDTARADVQQPRPADPAAEI